jgi:hypothetical protein
MRDLLISKTNLKPGGDKMKKAVLLFAMTMFIALLMSGAAYAGVPTVIGVDGSSLWTYQDGHDAAAKPEGGYAPFDDPAESQYAVNPHGGYDDGTNKCKICHAVHRAEGAYYLLRSDTQDDACNYCHIGGGAHSELIVYDNGGISTSNGHTIGSSAIIPDSSVKQWTQTVTLSTVDANGAPLTEDVQVRAYDQKRNEMFRFAKHHGQSAVSTGRNGYMRIGPFALRCMSCHQQHNATNMVWKPTNMMTGTPLTAGYKLLRLSPSASIQGTATETVGGVSYPVNYDNGMENYTSYDEYDPANGKFFVNAANVVKVPETTMTASNTGPGHTIYTTFTGSEASHGEIRDPQTMNQYAISAWCADCHNLDIGYWKGLTNEELGFRSHADRTHPAPYTGAYNGPGQCYSCHRNDLPNAPTTSGYDATRAACEECHFGTGSYRVNKAGSDFPHSGDSNSIKLLGRTTAHMDASGARVVNTSGTVTENNIDGVCLRCHTGIGTNH